MRQGIILRGVGGFYDVQEDDGNLVRCRLRGRFKQEGISVMAGDRVIFDIVQGQQGVIEAILPRQSELVRPSVANVDQVIIVIACAEPEPQLTLLDRLLVLAENLGLSSLICLNKIDLVPESVPADLERLYKPVGYKVLRCSAKTGAGVADLRRCLQGKISTFAGPSGVGKSSLLNAVEPGVQLKTGEISEKIGRGKHTTRHVELIRLSGGGYVADTPGFSVLRLGEIEPTQLDENFPEIANYGKQCRFPDCLHRAEPGCQVRAAVEAGKIASSRYDSYCQFLEEVENEKRNRYS